MSGTKSQAVGGYPEIRTVNELFLRVAGLNRPDAMLMQDEGGAWRGISSKEIYQQVRALARAFLAWGIERGDRIALLSENRWEWQVTDFAVLAIGAVDVPIYPTLTSEQIGELLHDSGARVAVVSTRAMYDKVAAVAGRTALEHVVMMDSVDVPPDAVMFCCSLKPGASPNVAALEGQIWVVSSHPANHHRFRCVMQIFALGGQ